MYSVRFKVTFRFSYVQKLRSACLSESICVPVFLEMHLSIDLSVIHVNRDEQAKLLNLVHVVVYFFLCAISI